MKFIKKLLWKLFSYKDVRDLGITKESVEENIIYIGEHVKAGTIDSRKIHSVK